MVDLALRHKLERARARWTSLVAVEGAAWTGFVMVCAALLCFHLDWNVALTAQQRIACWLVAGALLALCLLLMVARRCLRQGPDEWLAARIEQRFPALKE